MFFVDFSVDQWRFMTSLTGGAMRDNCVDEFFYPCDDDDADEVKNLLL